MFLSDQAHLNPMMRTEKIIVMTSNIRTAGQINADQRNGKLVDVLDSMDSEAYYCCFANLLGDRIQEA